MFRHKHITRRALLKGAAAAAFGTPLVVRSSTLGADGSTAPSERITLGFIGVGKQGHYHVCHMADRSDVEILAVCDVQQSRREAAGRAVQDRYSRRKGFKNAYKGLALVNDFRELLARDDIDAVVISTPEHWHAIPAIEAAKAGKDIYGEKPLSLTVREARAMVDAVRLYGRVFQTGSMQRSSEEFRFACEMVRSGRIGQLKRIFAGVRGPSKDCYLPAEPVPKGVDWNMWLGPAPWRPYNSILCPPPSFTGWAGWEHYRDYSGGYTTSWGSHHFDIAQWAMGTDHTGPVEIIPPNGKDVELLTYRYANGVTLSPQPRGPQVAFHGTEGRIEVSRGRLRTWPESLMRKPTGPDEVHLYRSPDHYTDWLRSIRTRQKPICDVEIGCRTVTVCHLGNIALWLNRPLKWDPVAEQIIGDAEANRWLARPKRPPWTL